MKRRDAKWCSSSCSSKAEYARKPKKPNPWPTQTTNCENCGTEIKYRTCPRKFCKNCLRERTNAQQLERESRFAGYDTHWEYIKADPKRLADHHARSKLKYRNTQLWLNNYKSERGCVDCGWNLHPAGLQLDHTGPKEYDFSLIKSSRKKFIAELENGRAEVRCANCHSIKTWAEKNALPYSSELYRCGKIANEILSAQINQRQG